MDGEEMIPMPAQVETPVPREKKDRTMLYVAVALGLVALLAVAFFVVPMVISVLFFTGSLNPRNVTPTSCTFPPGISCTSYKLNTDGSLDLRVGQATGHIIVVDGIACTAGGIPAESEYTGAAVEIPQGEQKWVAGQDTGVRVRCGNGGDAGEFYKGKIWIKYTEKDTARERTVVGDLAAKYEN